MNLPEPLAWVHKNDFGRLMFSSSPTVPPWSFQVFSEDQLREAYEAGRKAENALWMLSSISQEIDELVKENKLPEPGVWSNIEAGMVTRNAAVKNALAVVKWEGLFTEAQLREALAHQAEELKHLQEQNTALDAKLASNAAVMRQVIQTLRAANFGRFTFSIIKALEGALKCPNRHLNF